MIRFSTRLRPAPFTGALMIGAFTIGALTIGTVTLAGAPAGAAQKQAASTPDLCENPPPSSPARPVLNEPTGTAQDPIVVGVKPLDPFVLRDGGVCSGFSIELWDEVARRNGWATRYVWEDTLPPLLDDVQSRRVDAAIAGISITREREEQLDFSYPMFNAGLQIMVSRSGSGVGSWAAELRGFVTASVGKFLLALIIVLFIAGNVVWLAGRRRAAQPVGYLSGVGDGMFRAAAVGLAGDLGAGDPRRPIGRVMSVGWVIVGVCFVSLFTAAVTSRLTVSSIRSDIGGVSDLAGRKVATVAGSTAEGYLKERGLAYSTVSRIEDAYPRLSRGQIDAIVYDAPVLQHHAVSSPGTVLLVGPVFKPEDYGIAMPLSSPLRKTINATLLDMRADGAYERIYQRYFGVQGS